MKPVKTLCNKRRMLRVETPVTIHKTETKKCFLMQRRKCLGGWCRGGERGWGLGWDPAGEVRHLLVTLKCHLHQQDATKTKDFILITNKSGVKN